MLNWVGKTWQQFLDTAQAIFAALPPGSSDILLLLGAVLLGLFAHIAVRAILRRFVGSRYGLGRSILRRTKGVTRLGVIVLSAVLLLPVLNLDPDMLATIRHGLTVLLIILIGWTIILAINVSSDLAARRYRIDVDDNLQARKYLTQIRVLKRVAVIVVFLITAGAVLLTFEGVREYGLSLFASAGVAGIVLGIAARPVLTNLIAGIQIALTQPIRIEDAVVIEDEWGWVEEIGATYVVIRIWDWRRLIVPISYFIEQPFENWTRDSGSIIGTVLWYLDYTVPVDAFREKLESVIERSPHWDGRVVSLQVTETSAELVTLRGLMSARTSPQAWDLRCEIREKMITWLQREYPDALPRTRAEFVDRTSETALAGKDKQAA